MKIIISPAKKMNIDTDNLITETVPKFIDEAEQIKSKLQSMTLPELQTMWKCNDNIAKQNIERLQKMNLQRNLTPAIFSYEGIQYKNIAANVFDKSQLDYADNNLRILSGFYGVLRAFDGVTPYRLEMQAKLQIAGNKNLYDYWGSKLADSLISETDFILNLASKEYSESIKPYLSSDIRYITCMFCELKDGKLIEKGTLCKMARGAMVRYLAENNIMNDKDIKSFDEQGYKFSLSYSSDDCYVFIKGNQA